MTVERKDEEAPRKEAGDDAGGQGGKFPVVLFVVVLVIIIAQIVYLRSSGTDYGKENEAVPATPAFEGPSPNPAGSGAPRASTGAGSAVDGTLRMDKLIAGLVLLEQSSTPLTAEQKKKIVESMAARYKENNTTGYLSDRVDKILTPAQRGFLTKQMSTSGTKPLGVMSPDVVRAVRNKLIRIAGDDAPSPVEVPPDYEAEPLRPAPGRPVVPSLILVVNLYDLLEKDRSLAVTAAQARKLLAVLKAYTPPADPSTQTRPILAALTKAQKEQIDRSVKGLPDRPEMIVRNTEKLNRLLNIEN